MMFGPRYIYKCTNCGKLLGRGSLLSGNTFGAMLYSDGKSIAPMLQEFPNLVQCKNCHTFLWLNRLVAEGEYSIEDKQVDPSWKDADPVDFLNIDDYYLALDTLTLNKNDEIFIRTRIWWAFNDKIRNGETTFDEDVEQRWKENCNQLIELLDPNDLNQNIMIAELYRNLGMFEKCSSIIHAVNKDDLNWIKELFIKECERENKYVIHLKRGRFW
ncbi:MAG: hypothetical protein ABIY35_03130 [Chitinophagaceae bacterium]